MANIKELSEKIPERLGPGHRLCAGCGASIVVRQVLMGTEEPVVAVCATGCLEVATTIYPYTAWNIPFMHNAFENAASTISGIETAYRALKKKGKIKKEIKFVAFGGDGGTYDIGLQALSGALERGHNFVYVCYDNEAYMNCLSLSSLIATKDGLKKITEIKVGDEVYAFDMKTHQLVLKRCSGIFDNGVKDVYELSTLHHSIKATSNHPFLVAIEDIKGGTSRISCKTKTEVFAWKTLEQTRIGDEITILKGLEEGFEYEEVVSIKYVGKEPTLDLRVEDEHNFIANGIVVHNTGIQRSGATPYGASTTTAPAGKVIPGKLQFRKDLTAIVAAHRIPYVAQATISNWNDLVTKSQKAFAVEGPAFLNVLSMCHRGWRYPQEDTVKIAKLAVETGFWPLIEVENGVWRFTYKPKQRKSIEEFLKVQGRFKHLFTEQNKHLIAEIQKEIDSNWTRLEHLCEASCKVA